MTAERLAAMIGDEQVPLWDLDQAFWARERGVDYPLTHYDLETWEESVREGDPAARAVSDTGDLFRLIEDRYPGHRLDLRAEGGRARVSLLITETRNGRLPVGASGQFEGKTTPSQIGRAIALATVRADGLVRSLEQRLWAVSGLAEQVRRYAAWPVEEVTAGRFGAVDHENRLLCATANSPEGAARHAGMNHKGDYGILLCRERYDKTFPTPVVTVDDPLAEAPIRPDPEADLVWMVGTRDSVPQDAFTAGPDSAPDILKLGMQEGEILIGKDRRGEVRVVREMGPDGLVDLPDRLDALRPDESPEP